MRYRFGPFQFDTRNAQLEGPDGMIALRPMTVKLLHALLEAAPDLLSHEQLLDRIWGRQAVTPGVMSQSIRELRRALGDSAQAPTYIETRHKLGYRFAGALERIPGDSTIPAPGLAAAPADAPVPPPAMPERDHRVVTAPSPSQSTPWIIATTTVVVLALLAGGLIWRSQPTPMPAQVQTVEIIHDGRPREPEALHWYRDGLQALADHDPVRAQEQFERALQREPNAIATLAGLAQALAERGEMRQAQELALPLREGAAALPREAQLRIAAFLARLEHRNDEALRHLTALWALNPGDADAGFRLASLQIESAHTDDADATLKQLESLPRPQHARLSLLRAGIAEIRGDQAARIAAAQEAADSSPDTLLRAQALLEQANALLQSGDVDAAAKLHATLPELAQWPVLRLRADLFTATLKRETGKLPEAIALFHQCADSAREFGLPALNIIARREAAYAQFIAGNYDEADSQLDALAQEQTALGNPRALASILAMASLVQQRRGDNAAAQDLIQQALTIYSEIGDLAGQATARNTLGMLHARTGRQHEAQQTWEDALGLFERIGVRRGAATVRSNLAIVYGQAGRTVAAREANEAALAIFRDIAATPDVARLQFNLGIQDRNNGDLAQAEVRLREALDAFTTIGAASFRLQATATLAELRLMRADPEGAHALLADLDPAEISPPERAAAIATAQARLAMLRGDLESADAGFTQARNLRKQAELADWVLASELDLAELSARRGNLAHAEQHAHELRRDMIQHDDARAALQAGILIAAIRHARGDIDGAARQLDKLDDELVSHPDASLAMRLDLIRAAQNLANRHASLSHFATRARASGFDLLALRADMLAGNVTQSHLATLGIQMQGIPPTLPY